MGTAPDKWLQAMLPLMDWRLWIGPGFFMLLGLVMGLVVEKLLIGMVCKIFRHTSLELNDRIVSLIRGVIFWMFALWGLYMATYSMTFLEDRSVELVRTVVFVLAMLLAVRLLAQVAVALVRFYLVHSDELQALPNTSIFEHIIRIVVYILGLLMVLQTLGVSVLPLVTALGVGGLAISLALQDTLANVFAGINMILARQIKIGDYIKLDGGFEGFVEDISWRNTVIRQTSNNRIIVPNNKMASAIIVNCSLPLPETSLVVEVGVAYGSDMEQVEQVTVTVAREVLKQTKGAVAEFEPFIRVHNFAESSINFSVILQVQTWVDQYLVKHEFLKTLYARYNQEGIDIPFPQRVLHLDGEQFQALVTRPSIQG